jgi:hypothetical protein
VKRIIVASDGPGCEFVPEIELGVHVIAGIFSIHGILDMGRLTTADGRQGACGEDQ